METSRKAVRLTASVCLLALAACSGGGGGASPNTNTTTNNTNTNTSNNNTSNNTSSTTPVSIGSPSGTSSGGTNVSFNFSNAPPPVGTSLPLQGPVARLTSTAVTFPNVTDATATYRGTTVSGGITYPVFDISIPSLSVSASNVKGDNTPVTLSNGGQVSAAVATLNYLALGVWTYSQSGNTATYLGQAVTGSLTPASSVPSLGTASYNGSGSAGGVVGGFFVPSTSAPVQGGSLGGDVNLNVNFGANSVTGTLSNMHANTTAGGSGTTPWNNVSLSGNLTRSTSVSMGGSTSTSGPPAGAGAAGFSSAATGTFTASFYGPSGQEVGGSWTLSESTAGGTKTAIGTFAAH